MIIAWKRIRWHFQTNDKVLQRPSLQVCNYSYCLVVLNSQISKLSRSGFMGPLFLNNFPCFLFLNLLCDCEIYKLTLREVLVTKILLPLPHATFCCLHGRCICVYMVTFLVRVWMDVVTVCHGWRSAHLHCTSHSPPLHASTSPIPVVITPSPLRSVNGSYNSKLRSFKSF